MAKGSATDIELGHLNAETAYFQEVNEFEVLLASTADMVQKLKEANQDFNSATESVAMKEIKGCMEKDMDELGKMAHTMKVKLGKIIKNNVENRKNQVCEMGTAIDISRMSLNIVLKTKLKETKNYLENLGKSIHQEYLEVIHRRTFTVTGINLSDEVIRLIDTGSVVQLFENALQGISAEQMVAAVDEIKERHAVATDFGKKILEVQKNFKRMVRLVELVEKMDQAVDKAVNKVQKLVIRAESAEEELRNERAENNLLRVLLIGLPLMFLFFTVIRFLTSR